MAAYLPVVSVCAAQSREAESVVLHSLERQRVCVLHSLERQRVCVLHSLERQRVCVLHSLERQRVCVLHSLESQTCRHNTDYVLINGHDRTITVILAKYCIKFPDDETLVIRNTLEQF